MIDRRRVTELVNAALDLDAEGRRELLHRECPEDPNLRAEVESLLQGEEALSDGFLDVPAAVELIERIARQDPQAVAHPQTVGPYRVLGMLGSGGMGTVYLAEQEQPVERRIALKVMDGLAPASGGPGFVDECRALARLKHPNVATLFDAGVTSDGQAFVAMEWIEGSDITGWCDRHRLSVDARLRLFLGVCAGVGHAHRKGIVHRDLKPSNVLVAEVDGVAVAKVIDFGIARALDEPSTGTGRQKEAFVGTPSYMSPESMGEGGAADIDTRSDVYSLGVLLYELLVGCPPFELEGLSLGAIRRHMGSATAPPVGERWRDLEPEERSRIAGRRRTEPDALARRLRGDLEAVLTKALARDPERRYESPSDLAADLQRHFDLQPVAAREPTPAYRLERFVRRNLGAVAAGTAMLALLLLGFVARTQEAGRANREAVRANREAVRANREADRANREAVRANQEADRARQALTEARDVSDFLIDLFEVADPNRGPDDPVSVHELLERAEASLVTDLADQPSARARFYHSLGRIAMNLGDFQRAEALHGEALTLREELGDPVDLAETLGQLGIVYRRQERLDLAEVQLEQAVQLLEQSEAQDPMQLSGAINRLANLRWQQGQVEAAVAGHRRALDIRRRLDPEQPLVVGESLVNLGVALRDQGLSRQAAVALREAAGIIQHTRGDDHPWTAALRLNLAGVEENLGRWTEAEKLLQQSEAGFGASYGPVHPRTLLPRRALGVLWTRWHRFEEAEAHLRRLLAAQEAEAPDDRLEIARTLNDLGRVLLLSGDLVASEAFLQRGLAIRVELLDEGHLATERSLTNLALLAQEKGDLAKAEAFFRGRAESFRSRFGDQHLQTANAYTHLGVALSEQGRYREAEEALRTGLDIRQAAIDSPSKTVARSLFHLGEVFEGQGRVDEARDAFLRCLDIRLQVLPTDHPSIQETRDALAKVSETLTPSK